MQMPVMWFCVE